MPNLFIIAGPNGAGKSTYVQRFLPKEVQCTEFVNADLIAGGALAFCARASGFCRWANHAQPAARADG